MGEILELEVTGLELADAELDVARARITRIAQYVDRPLQSVRLTVRYEQAHATRQRYEADATVVLNGRLLAAHTTGSSAQEATDVAVERLRRQMRRSLDAYVAQRNEPRLIESDLADLGLETPVDTPPAQRTPPEDRRIIYRHTLSDEPRATYAAMEDLLELDLRFLLFVHARTNEDVVVHRIDADHVGLLFPPGSALADEGDEVVVPEPSRFPDAIPLQLARETMDVLDHGWLYFLEQEDGRGKVMYVREDGDYGLVEPEGLVHADADLGEEEI